MEKEKRTRREARGRRNGKSASVCGHYGTTAIIRDFPFAPYLFLVSLWRARVLTHTEPWLSVPLPPPSGCTRTRWRAEKRQMYLARDSGNEKRATNGFSAALVRVHSDETMERGELDEKKEEVTEEVTTGV